MKIAILRRVKPWVLCGFVSGLAVLDASAAGAQSVILSFNSLPREQGWAYRTNPAFLGVHADETDVFSVPDGWVLHQNTMDLPLVQQCVTVNLDPYGSCDRNYYTMNDVVDHSHSFVLDVRARVLQENDPPFYPAGFGFFVTSRTDSMAFFLGLKLRDGMLRNVMRIPIDWMDKADVIELGLHDDRFHDYRLEASFGSPGVYKLFVDNALLKTGTIPPGGNFCAGLGICDGLVLGDADSGGNAEADLSRYSFSQPSCATDATGAFAVSKSGYVYNFATQRFSQTVKLTNISGAPITGPISLALDGLSANASLFNASGTTSCSAPLGSSYVMNMVGGIAPGASVSLVLQFTNPTRGAITYATRVLTGAGGR